MSAGIELETRLSSYVQENQAQLVNLIQQLVQIPSENTPPRGNEAACQRHVASLLEGWGCPAELYSLEDLHGLKEHPRYWPGRDYRERPNLAARRLGSGGGRSLILSGHMDTVPRGTQPWTRDPMSGEVSGNHLYGRGSNDMKGGVGTNLFVMKALHDLGIELKGDLVFETVVDEEFGGVNGTLAGRIKGYLADAAVISEPSFLRICPAQRGGRLVHIFLKAPGGILTSGEFPLGVIEQLTHLLNSIPEFAESRRRSAPAHPFFANHADPVPVSITKVFTAPWGNKEPITPPETCQIELYWQAMPGESQEAVEKQFYDWFEHCLAARPGLFPERPRLEFPMRWLPGSAISLNSPLVRELSECASRVLGHSPEIVGLEGPCDMYIFHEFGIPAVLWGATGGNTHAADEYLEIDSVIKAAETLLRFVCRWCGTVS
jgi:acetylornithine deacetylase